MRQTTVSHYEIERKIGEGGMGEIYLTRDMRLNRPVAMLQSVNAHSLLGRTFEQSGWKDEAILQYREFLEFWGDGDKSLTEVNDARTRLVRLQTRT